MHSPLRHVPRRLAALSAVAALTLSACGDDSPTLAARPAPVATSAPAGPAAAGVVVDTVWARSSPTMARAGAVYLTVDNPGAEVDALLGAEVGASVAGRIELHEMVATAPERDGGMSTTPMGGQHDSAGSGGMMTMQPVERVEISPGGTVTLAPGGYHLMLLDLVEPLEVGDRFEVTLSFERAGDVTVTADVRDSAP